MNHLTAARVYRKLAELGYVTAQVGRGTFVRALTPDGSAAYGDDWQVYALPPDEFSYSEQILADTFSLADREDVLSLATGWPAPSNYPRSSWPRSPRTSSRRSAATPSPTCPPRACSSCARRWPRAAASTAGPRTPTRSS